MVTLYYEGEDARRALGGVVILRWNPATRAMDGHWWEFTPERGFVGGSTEWKKQP